MISDLLISMRPRQWSKNLLVFVGLLFAQDMLLLPKIQQAVTAFLLFCLTSGAVYLLNDVFDRKKDAQHPLKRFRPIAAGRLSPLAAILTAGVLAAVSLFAAFRLDGRFGAVMAAYLIMTLAYSAALKNVIIVDVLIIASGFVLRAVGGAWAIQEAVSSWLIICTIFLALFMALGKRRAEVLALGEHAGQVRKTLVGYDRAFLDQMIIISTAACLMSYALYTLDTETVIKFGTRNLVLTLPLVIYGLFRYLYLIYHENRGESPENAVLGDRAILLCVALYVLVVAVVLYT
jgi:4-hydroxybenzoate polyprenyltransferase